MKLLPLAETATNNNVHTEEQTPIEIALQIDENGMTTASRLYAFLELEPGNFARWCKKNIIGNKFATENSDYEVFVIQEENLLGGRPKTDYKLTSNFAKKLSMTGNTERHEQARQYFIACEQGLKVATEKIRSNHSDEKLADALNGLNNSLTNLNDRMTKLEESQNRRITDTKYPSAWYRKMSPRYKMLTEYFHCSTKELYSNIYKELEDTYDIDLNLLMDDYCYENRISKDNCYMMDVIEHNRQLRDATELLVNDSLVKYRLQTEDGVKRFKRHTLFDMTPSEVEIIASEN